MVSKIIAGLLAGLPLSAVFVLYFIVRGKAFVTLLKSTSPDMAGMADNGVFYLFLGSFALGAFLFGAAAGVVYHYVGSSQKFLVLAIGAAVLMSLLVVISRTPMPVDKIFMNFVVGGLLGVLVPLFEGK